MRRVAEELGTSYVELIKACTAMDIPRPKGGEWKSFLLGQTVEPVPLPQERSGVAEDFLLRPIETFSEEELPPLLDAACVPETKAQKGETVVHIDESVEPVRNKGPVTVTREELYEKVWQMSLQRLAKECGTSYTQLVSACEAMNVPRPPNGHWVRLALGMSVEKLAMPEQNPGTCMEFTLQPQLSHQQRLAKAREARQPKAGLGEALGRSVVEDVASSAGSGDASHNAAGVERHHSKEAAEVQPAGKRPGPGWVELPLNGVLLHAIAVRHVEALQKARVGELGFVSVRGRDLFWCDMTVGLVTKFGQALHALVGELELRGYRFENGKDESEGLGIVREGDRVEVRWSEEKIELEREPTNVEKRRPSWTWNLKETQATGDLAVEVNAFGLKGRRKWKEGDGRALEEILGVVVEKIEGTFRWYGEQRKRKADLARQQEEAEKRSAEEAAREAERQARLEEERKVRERILHHEAKLKQIAELRRQNLVVAAKLWIQARGVAAYVAYCEATWRVSAGGALPQAQAGWLTWAKAEAARMEPFGRGYPVPANDGNLDGSAIAVGGPYPEPTELEELPEVEPEQPAAEREVRYVEVPPQREQFPFWLLHRKH